MTRRLVVNVYILRDDVIQYVDLFTNQNVLHIHYALEGSTVCATLLYILLSCQFYSHIYVYIHTYVYIYLGI